jgi:hypothetical protein
MYPYKPTSQPSLFYVLKDGKPVPERDPRNAGAFIGSHVDKTLLRASNGTEICISTVFLGVDHNYSGKGPPVLWKTMIFWDGNDLDSWQKRYTSEEAAREGHQAGVAMVKALCWKRRNYDYENNPGVCCRVNGNGLLPDVQALPRW